MNAFIDYLTSEKTFCLPKMEQFVDEQILKYGKLTNEYGELLTQLRTYLTRGGKWHRPALTLLSYRVSGGKQIDKMRRPVLVTELIHRFLLVHDDIIDQDLTRHGGPTIEKIYKDRFLSKYPNRNDIIYSKANAIVAGDIVNALGYELITSSDLDDATRLAMLAGVNQMILETAAGWQLQNEQNYQAISDVTCEDFFKGMQLVSCQYSIVWPLRFGEILAGKLTQNSWDTHLEEFGWNCGAAFQIIDDIIGMFGDEKATGKPAGHDYREGKKTFLILKAYENANEVERNFLNNTLGTQISADELLKVRKIIKDTGSLEYSQTLAKNHADKALGALEHINSKSREAIDLLSDFTRFLADRTH